MTSGVPPPDLGRIPRLRGRVGGVDVVLRPWGAPPADPGADAPALATAWADPEVARWTAAPPTANSGPPAGFPDAASAGPPVAPGAGPGTTAGPGSTAAGGERGQALGHATPPAAGDREVAARWIAGEGERRARGLALDLVVGVPDDGGREVLGEVGLARFDDVGRAEIGFWLAPAGRGRGLATAAVTILARWALAPAGAAGATGSGKGSASDHFVYPEPGAGAEPGLAGGGLGLRRVWARTDARNERAAAVLVRAGFHRRGEVGGSAAGSAARSVVWTLDAASLRA